MKALKILVFIYLINIKKKNNNLRKFFLNIIEREIIVLFRAQVENEFYFKII